MYLSEFLTIAVAHLFAVASPGPDFAIVMRQSISNGRGAGLWTSAGVALAILLHVTYCVLGVGLLLSSSPNLFMAVKIIAAFYLVLLGYRAFRDSLRHAEIQVSDVDSQSHKPGKWLLTGFLTNGLNPKATLFFLALFTVVIDIETPFLVQAFYGVYLSLATFCWFAMLSVILAIGSVREWFLKSGAWFERIMGLVLIGLGLQLAWTLPPLSG
ncbi:MAG: LysE family translocator [Gammaproteobacteria bacterium]|nr:LysE family translocator [Gammaproteobacteria bacterium]